jgi:hypothetical protein
VESEDSILAQLDRIEGNTMTSIGNEAELVGLIEAATARTTKVGEEIKSLLEQEANLSPETMEKMTALADGLIALDAMNPDAEEPVEETPVEQPFTDGPPA